MAAVMLGTEIAVLLVAIVAGGVLLYLNRSQGLVRDTTFMRATRNRVMKRLIEDIEVDGERAGAPLPARPAVVTPDMEPGIREAVR